jgi:hypothetical protein
MHLLVKCIKRNEFSLFLIFMKKSHLHFLLFFLLIGACQSPANAPVTLTEHEQIHLLDQIIRYMGHLPKKGSHENKFEDRFDHYYQFLILDYTIEAYKHDSEYEYLLTSRITPSLKVKKIAIGIKLKREKNGKITYYEEVFRTWKFAEDEMKKKGQMLFDQMVKGKDLSPYYPQNSNEEYIEFPDERVKFDTETRRWMTISQN